MRYLLSLCVLFLSGLSPLTAHSGGGVDLLSVNAAHQTSVDSNKAHCNEQTGSYFHSSNSEGKRANDFLDVAEVKVEEDEVHVTKKYLHTNNYATVPADSRSAAYFFKYLKHCKSACNQTPYYSTGESRNIAFGVFRL